MLPPDFSGGYMKTLLLMLFAVCCRSVCADAIPRLYEASKGGVRILLLPESHVLLKSEVDDYFVRVVEEQAKNVNLVLDEHALFDHLRGLAFLPCGEGDLGKRLQSKLNRDFKQLAPSDWQSAPILLEYPVNEFAKMMTVFTLNKARGTQANPSPASVKLATKLAELTGREAQSIEEMSDFFMLYCEQPVEFRRFLVLSMYRFIEQYREVNRTRLNRRFTQELRCLKQSGAMTKSCQALLAHTVNDRNAFSGYFLLSLRNQLWLRKLLYLGDQHKTILLVAGMHHFFDNAYAKGLLSQLRDQGYALRLIE